MMSDNSLANYFTVHFSGAGKSSSHTQIYPKHNRLDHLRDFY